MTPHTLRRIYITLMLEAGAPVPYGQGQVGHEDATTTLNIYAQVLKRQGRRRHGEAFDALMAGAVPSDTPFMIPGSSMFPTDLVTENRETEPSHGLEPWTPSLPSIAEQFWGEHDWLPEDTYGLQMRLFERDAEEPS